MTARSARRLLPWVVGYAVAGLLALAVPTMSGLSVWYPPLVVGIGLLLRHGLRWWPVVLVVELASAATQVGLDPAAMLGLAVPIVVETVVAAWLFRRLDLALEGGEQALGLVATTGLIALVGAATASAASLLVPSFPATAGGVWQWWLLCDVTTIATLMPLVLLVLNRRAGTLAIPRHRLTMVEVPAIILSSIVGVAFAAAMFAADPVRLGFVSTMWVIPILWVAVRYERLLTAVVVAVLATSAFLAFTLPGVGLGSVDMVGLQATLIAISTVGFMVSSTLAGRRKATTELEQALAALAASEQRYSHVFTGSPAIQLLVDPDSRAILDASEAASRFYGYGRDELRSMHISDLNVDAPAVLDANIARGRAQPVALFVTHRKRDGQLRQMELRTGPIEIDGREVLHSILRDATDELAARSEVARLAAAVESSAEAVVTTDLDGLVTGWNGAAEQLYGYPREIVLRRPVEDFLGPLDIPAAELAQLAREGRSIRFGHMIRRTADGEALPVDLTISPIIAEGEVVGMSRISHDLRDIMREEQRLRRSEALLADAAEVGRMGSWEVDPETGAATWSDELYRITGVAPGTPVDAGTLNGLAHPDDLARVDLAFAGGEMAAPLRFRLRTADGEERFVVATWRHVAGDRGEGARIVGVLRDVTEERKLEEQLRQAQRLESIGMLAGGVAHDFNNLLTAIAGFTDLARVAAEEGDSPDADLRQVQAAVERGRALTMQLLAFGRKTPAKPRPVDVGIAVNALVPMLRRLLGEDITILTELEPDVVAIIDPGQLDQVLVNLAVNARDAMPAGGRLRIAAGRLGAERTTAGPVSVWIEVEDDGAGIEPELLDRIFMPFFTTKERGQGTGLGLATVQGHVTAAGGTVEVSSRTGAGTLFRVELPGITGTAARVEDAARSARATGDGLVLLVEDEDLVRQVAKRILERAGFRVLAAANAPDALEIAARGRPDILVSDIVLPGMGDGISLAEDLHERWPDLPILLMTGYTERVPPSWARLLTKPYEMDELVEVVRELCDEAVLRAEVGAVGSGPGG